MRTVTGAAVVLSDDEARQLAQMCRFAADSLAAVGRPFPVGWSRVALELAAAVSDASDSASDSSPIIGEPIPKRDDWVTTTTAAARLGVTQRTVRTLLAEGWLVGHQAVEAGSWLVEPESIEREAKRRAGTD